MNSFLDVGCSKGFFTLQATLRGTDALGIDIDENDLAASVAIRDYLGLTSARFEQKTLNQLASESQTFDLIQVANTYHYLYFGSSRTPACATDHSTLFAYPYLATLTSGTLVFSNPETLKHCPTETRGSARAGKPTDYTPDAIRSAASKWFDIEEHGSIGKRPLWAGRRK